MKRDWRVGKMSADERGGRTDKAPTESRLTTRDVRQQQTKRSKTPNTASKVTTGDSDRLAALEANLYKVITLLSTHFVREEKKGWKKC